MLSQSQAENSQYTLARTFARQNVSMEETVLAGATSTIADMKALIVNAGGTESDNDRQSLATQLQGRRSAAEPGQQHRRQRPPYVRRICERQGAVRR